MSNNPRWKVTSTSAKAGQSVEFVNALAALKFWEDLCGMYPNDIHTLWQDGKIIKHN
jgi:hypothetical protein